MKPTLMQVPIAKIDHNPWRELATYPFRKEKVSALRRSIDETWFWEGVQARRVGSRYQIAFGHHRIEAAKQNGLKRVPLIVRDLTDDEMLKLMGLENLEDYNSDFLIQLNTWDAAVKRHAEMSRTGATLDTGREIATLLGWTRPDSRSQYGRMNDIADACHQGRRCLDAKALRRSDFKGMSVRKARDLASTTMATLDQLEKQRETKPKHVVEAAIEQAKGAARATAQHIHDTERNDPANTRAAYQKAAAAARREADLPLFGSFARATARSLETFLMEDSRVGERLGQMAKARNSITNEQDFESLAVVVNALDTLIEIAKEWREDLEPTSKSKIINFKKAVRQLAAGE